jgi:hypothetical protein
MATMATVDAATITRNVLSGSMCPKTIGGDWNCSRLASSGASRPRMVRSEWSAAFSSPFAGGRRARICMRCRNPRGCKRFGRARSSPAREFRPQSQAGHHRRPDGCRLSGRRQSEGVRAQREATHEAATAW